MTQTSRGALFPVSIKGVVPVADRFVLLLNERGEWELPGGRLEPGEDPAECLAREIFEELSLAVEVGPILDCWRYQPLPDREVVIVTYGTRLAEPGEPRVSAEHRSVKLFGIEELARIKLPQGYAASIRRWREIAG
jgi:8-oxo-dGTP pyrophosphatase MutT (NUDIX family)